MPAPAHTRAYALTSVAVATTLAGTLSACQKPGVIFTLAADSIAPASYCVTLGAGDERRYGARFSNADKPLPQSIGAAADGQNAATARLDGIGADGLVSERDWLGVTFGNNVVAAKLTLSACAARPTGAMMQRASATQGGDRLAVVRSGAEAAGGAELVALGGTTGARFRYAGGMLAPESSSTLGGGAGSTVSDLDALDVDGDCADNLVVASATLPVTAWPSMATGDLTSSTASIPAAPNARAQALGDVTADGWADLVVVGDAGGSVLPSDRAHGFGSPVGGFDTSPTGAQAIALGDLDADGKLDAVVGFQSGPLRWYKGDAAGHFALQPALPGSFATRDIAILDLDGDKRPDIVAATQDQGLRVFLNQGGGTFVNQSSTAVPASLSTDMLSVLVTDLDADCHDDLVVLADAQAPVWLGWSQGTLAIKQGIDSDAAQAAAAGDLDGDGVPELSLITNGKIVVFSTVGGAS